MPSNGPAIQYNCCYTLLTHTNASELSEMRTHQRRRRLLRTTSTVKIVTLNLPLGTKQYGMYLLPIFQFCNFQHIITKQMIITSG